MYSVNMGASCRGALFAFAWVGVIDLAELRKDAAGADRQHNETAGAHVAARRDRIG